MTTPTPSSTPTPPTAPRPPQYVGHALGGVHVCRACGVMWIEDPPKLVIVPDPERTNRTDRILNVALVIALIVILALALANEARFF